MALKSAYEIALERIGRGEIPGRRDGPTQEPLPGLLDDGKRSDQFSQGYIPNRSGIDTRSAGVFVAEDPSMENGIDTLIFIRGAACALNRGRWQELAEIIRREKENAQQAFLVPLQGIERLRQQARQECDTDDTGLVALYERTLRNMVYARSTFEPRSHEFQREQRIHGLSNTHRAVLATHMGECYHVAAMLAGMLRQENIPARVVSFPEAGVDDWTQTCRRLGRFRAEYCPELVARGYVPDYIAHVAGTADLRDERLLGYLRGTTLIELDPADDLLRTHYHHVWVEAKVAGAWTTHDTTRINPETWSDPIMATLFEVLQPKRQILPEYRLCRKGGELIGHFKDPSAW